MLHTLHLHMCICVYAKKVNNKMPEILSQFQKFWLPFFLPIYLWTLDQIWTHLRFHILKKWFFLLQALFMWHLLYSKKDWSLIQLAMSFTYDEQLRAVLSLMSFRRRLKTELFDLTFSQSSASSCTINTRVFVRLKFCIELLNSLLS